MSQGQRHHPPSLIASYNINKKAHTPLGSDLVCLVSGSSAANFVTERKMTSVAAMLKNEQQPVELGLSDPFKTFVPQLTERRPMA